jgi:hypothetical protein
MLLVQVVTCGQRNDNIPTCWFDELFFSKSASKDCQTLKFLMFFPALLNEHGKGVLQQAGKSGTSGRTPLAAFRRLFTTFSGPIIFQKWHCHNNILYLMWRFPKVGVPLNHPFIDRFSIINHPSIGYLHLWKPPIFLSSTTLIDFPL